MSNSRENYRKKLSMTGLLFMGGVEHEMKVQNVSITGILVTIEPSAQVNDEHDIFLIMKESSLVDFYVRRLNLAGEAEVVRVDMEGGAILIGMEIRCLYPGGFISSQEIVVSLNKPTPIPEIMLSTCIVKFLVMYIQWGLEIGVLLMTTHGMDIMEM